MDYTEVFGLKFLSKRISLEDEVIRLLKKPTASFICVVDGNVLTCSNEDLQYLSILNNSAFCTCDGASVQILSRIFSSNMDLITGPEIITQLFQNKYKHLIVGTERDLRANVKKLLSGDFRLELDFFNLPIIDPYEYDYFNLTEKINVGNYDIIWVSLGAPKQDIFSFMLSRNINHGVIFGIGAGFELLNKQNNLSYLANAFSLLWILRIFEEPKRIGLRALRYIKTIPIILVRELLYQNRKKNE